MVKNKYIPEKGDLVWVNFDKELGHEQMGKRPALVLSSKIYNSSANLALVVPITSKSKGYPFEVLIDCEKIKGFILSDQVKSYDWNIREFSYICQTDQSVYDEVIGRLKSIMF